MAGNYPDLPAPRIEYDRDGTRVYQIVGTTVTELALATTQGLANEISENWRPISSAYQVLFVFPENRDVTHAYIDTFSNVANTSISWSNDSTTGLDGNWTTPVSNFPKTVGLLTSRYRTDIAATPGLTGVKMVRIAFGGEYITGIHLYGKSSTGQNLHRLRLWHPTLNQPLDDYPAHFDWGNIQQGTSDTRQFRVKNDSGSLTASTVTVFMQALTEASPTQVSQHNLSTDGTTWQAASVALAIPNLAPGALSNVLYLRRSTPSNAQLGLWRQRLVASAGAWA